MACTLPSGTLGIDWDIPIYAIHSRKDELFPFEKTERAIQRLITKGAQIEFVPLESATHYNTSSFIKPLMESTAWIKRVWG
jgi:predicted esterase